MTHPSVNSIVERLEPCPFCGGEAKPISGGPGNWFIQCSSCRASTDDVGYERAIERWNTRPAATIISELQAERVDKATAWGAVAEKNAEIADLRSRIKRLSDALLAARPLGGSELFVRWGDGFHADPEFFKDALERDKARYHEAMKRAVTAEKKLATAESSLSRIKAETIEECAKVADAKAAEFLSPEYATGQPLSSFNERFACEQVASAIRSLGSTGGGDAEEGSTQKEGSR